MNETNKISAGSYAFLGFLTLLNVMNFVDRQLLASIISLSAIPLFYLAGRRYDRDRVRLVHSMSADGEERESG